VDDFIEPVTGQRSVVALAPVGRTGLIVMVAMPDAALEEVKSTLQWRASVFIWAPLLAGMSLFGCVLTGPQLWRAWAQRYRQRRRSHV
jgi:hypothetical protein